MSGSAPKRAAKAVLSALRLDATVMVDPDQRAVGLQLVRTDRPDNRLFSGHAVVGRHEGREVVFFVANPQDEIQGVHAKGRFYEPEELDIIRRHYTGGTYVDVGANVGNHVLFLAKILDAPKIVAFEPNPPAARVLKVNIALNDLMQLVTVHEAGLAESAGSAVAVAATPNNLGGTHLEPGPGGIALARGDDVLAGEAVSFIKIDTEGMELGVLAGLRQTLERDRPALFVEVATDNDADFLRLMDGLGYRLVEQFRRYASGVNYMMLP